MSRKLVIPRLNASGTAPRYSDVDLMLRSRPRIIMLDGGIPPATPLPTKHWAGGFASLPCDSFAERAYWAREPTAHRQTSPYRQKSLPKTLCCQDHLAAQMRR